MFGRGPPMTAPTTRFPDHSAQCDRQPPGARNEAPRSQGSTRPALVVHPACHLPMHEARRTRAVASLAALLTPHLRDRVLGSGDLDVTEPLEVSSTPDPTPAEGDGDGQ